MFNIPHNNMSRQAAKIESDFLSLTVLYPKQNYKVIIAKFLEVQKELGYDHDLLIDAIFAGQVDLFADPPMLPKRPEINAADVNRIIDEMKSALGKK